MTRLLITALIFTTGIFFNSVTAQAQHHHCNGACCHSNPPPVHVETHYYGGHAPHAQKTVTVYRTSAPAPAPVYRTRRKSVRVVETRYVYYRDYDMYFDRARNVYFYLDHGNWQVSAQVPVFIKRSRNFTTCVKVNVDVRGDRPYVAYSTHRRIYAGL